MERKGGLQIKGGSTATKSVGGTSHILPAERKRATFNTTALQNMIQGDAKVSEIDGSLRVH
jgi:hypothetical protein